MKQMILKKGMKELKVKQKKLKTDFRRTEFRFKQISKSKTRVKEELQHLDTSSNGSPGRLSSREKLSTQQSIQRVNLMLRASRIGTLSNFSSLDRVNSGTDT